MFHSGILRETENASVGPNVNKLSASEQKPRMKTKALGDVQNTLHSRFGSLVNTNTSSEVKVSNKSTFYTKPFTNEKVQSGKSAKSGRNVNVTPTKSIKKSFVSTPAVDEEIFDIHDHILCEQDHQFFWNDYFKEYKCSEEQINHLTRRVKSFATPLSVELFEPCEDIEIPDFKTSKKDSFSVNKIFSDLIIPSVSAPIEIP